MKLIFIFLALILSFNFNLQAQDINNGDDVGTLQRKPGTVDCDQTLKRCEYVVQNMTARKLIKKIERILFEGGTLTRDMGYIEAETLKVLSFWLHDEDLMKRFKGLIPVLDTFESFDPTSLVQVSTDVIALTDTGYSNLEASISSIGDTTDTSSDWSISTGNGVMDLALAVGTKLVSSVLGSHKVKTYSKKLTTVTRFVPNLSEINFAQTSNVYISPNQTSTKEEKIGLEIDGEVSIERDNNKLIKIENYNFRYGVLVPAQTDTGLDRVNVLKVDSPELYFVNGISNMIVSSQTSEEEITTSFGLLNFGRGKTEKLSKMLVLTRAESISFEKVVEQMKRIRDLSLFGTFSDDQISSFPRSNVNFEEVLKTLKPYSFFTPSGDRVVGFHFDRNLARASNYKKSFSVKVSGAGLKTSGVRRLETLMISGFQFDTIPVRYLSKDLLKLKLQFREILPSGKKGKKVKKTLLYNPQTNRFIL